MIDIDFFYEPDYPYKAVFGVKTNNRKTIGINLSKLNKRSNFSRIISHEYIHATLDKLENSKTSIALDNLFHKHPCSKRLESLK